MANICEYRVIVKGRKNACYAFFGSMSCCEEKIIDDESGSNEDFAMRFHGWCKWDVDCYCTPWEGEFPVTLPEDFEKARDEAEEQYWYNTVKERSKMFDVEVWCNSADIDDPMFDYFEHYKNGEKLGGTCPNEIDGIVAGILGEGVRNCASCGQTLPEEEMIEFDESIWYCNECYNTIFC